MTRNRSQCRTRAGSDSESTIAGSHPAVRRSKMKATCPALDPGRQACGPSHSRSPCAAGACTAPLSPRRLRDPTGRKRRNNNLRDERDGQLRPERPDRGRAGGGWEAPSTPQESPPSSNPSRQRDSAESRSRPSTASRGRSPGSSRISPRSGCGCWSTRCVRRRGSASAWTWRPAPDGRSAVRGLANATRRAGWRIARGPSSRREAPRARSIRSACLASCDRLLRSKGQRAGLAQASPRKLQIGDLVQPLEANANLQALALEQVRFPRTLPILALIAYSKAGAVVDLTSHVSADGALDWTAPEGSWTLYGVFLGWHGKIVERAAPGGEGYVIDHFSHDSIGQLPRSIRQGLCRALARGLRAFFNDSYEVDDAKDSRTGRPRSSTNSRNGAATISGGTCRRSSATSGSERAIACWRTTG